MFIVVEDDVFVELDIIKDPFDIKILALDKLFETMYMGKHIVFSHIKNLRKLTKISVIEQRTKLYVEWVIREYTRIYSCKNIINKYISISTKYKTLKNNKDHYEIPLDYVLDLKETKLLTENESDGSLIHKITRYIFSYKGLSDFWEICFENDAYHGANGKSKIDLLSKTPNLVICVVDTDMDYPGGRKKDTYRAVNSAVKKAKSNIAINLIALPVREKENLFPASIYSKVTDSPLIHLISEKFKDDEAISNYFDIKDGVKYKKILHPDLMWNKYYGRLIEECIKNNICNVNLKEGDEEKIYIKGIGADLCDYVVSVFFDNSSEKKKMSFDNQLNKDKAFLYYEQDNIYIELPEFVISNWKNIFDDIFTWGCCINKKKHPAQRNW